jgi:galactonate dehydratase
MLAINWGDGTQGRVTHMDTFRFREFLDIHTDAGLTGLGESYFGAKLVEAYGDEVARHDLLSKHTLHIGEYAKELNGYLGHSSSGTQTRGDSAIDLVAPCRQKIPAYNSCAGYSYARTRPRVAIGDGKTPMPEGGAS